MSDSLAAVLALRQMLALERKLAVYCGTRRRSEVRHRYQVLQVVGEPAERVREATEISGVFQWITILQRAARRVVSAGVDHQWIIHPFADFMRQSGDVLGEVARMVHVREHRVGLRSAGKAKRAVIAADFMRQSGDVLGEVARMVHV